MNRARADLRERLELGVRLAQPEHPDRPDNLEVLAHRYGEKRTSRQLVQSSMTISVVLEMSHVYFNRRNLLEFSSDHHLQQL